MYNANFYIRCDLPSKCGADFLNDKATESASLIRRLMVSSQQILEVRTNEQRTASWSPKDLFPPMRGHEDGCPAEGGPPGPLLYSGFTAE